MKIKKGLLFVLLLVLTTLVVVCSGANIQAATWETHSVESIDLGYGVTLDKYHGESTSSFNSTTTVEGRLQDIYTVNVPKNSAAKVVQWSVNSGVENNWGSRTLESIAADYELKHPTEKVLAATNNWLSDTRTNNIGELDGPQVCDGIVRRVSDKQGPSESPVFKHDYIPRNNFLGFDSDGKTAYFSDDFHNGDNYTDYVALSFYNGISQERTMLDLKVDKINEAPLDGEIAIFFKNYDGSTVTFPGANIYHMKGQLLHHDNTPSVGFGLERDVCAKGTFVKMVDSISFDLKVAGAYAYYIVSKNETFNKLDLQDKVLVAQYELLGDFANVVGGTTYYCHIVRNGETYPGSFGHWNEINCEVHPRTAFIIKSDGSFALSVIDGRQKDKTGMDYEDMANFYKTMYDAKEAFNYDGGGSSCMIIANSNGGFDIVNSPSDGNERRVANATLVVVDREPFTLSQSAVKHNVLPFEISDVSENVDKVFVTIDGIKKEFVDNKVEYTGLTDEKDYLVYVSYVLKNSDVEIIGATYTGRTCGIPAVVEDAEFSRIKQDSAEFSFKIWDVRDTFYQGFVEVGSFKQYFSSFENEILISGLKSSTTYDVNVTVISKNGTKNMNSEVFTYKLTTAIAEYPEEINATTDVLTLEVGKTTTVKVDNLPEGTSTRYTYSSSDESIATVSSFGYIKGIAEGVATITVTTKEGITDTIDITIIQPTICTEHVDANKDGKCDICGESVPVVPEVCTEHVDANKDGKCDKCGEDLGTAPCIEHVDANKDGKCDVCGNDIAKKKGCMKKSGLAFVNILSMMSLLVLVIIKKK